MCFIRHNDEASHQQLASGGKLLYTGCVITFVCERVCLQSGAVAE